MNQKRIDDINEKMPDIVRSILESFMEQGYNPKETIALLASCLVTVLHNEFEDDTAVKALDSMKETYLEIINGRTRSS